jgi:O-antigen/teichoic acid export membrane protein
VVFLVWVPTALGLIFFGRPVIALWAGPAAVPDFTLLLAMIFYTLSSGLSLVVAYPLNGIGKLSSQIIGTMAIAVLHVPFALFLCGHLGEAGVAVSQSILMFLVTIPLAYAQFLRLVRPGAAPKKIDLPVIPTEPVA